MNVMTGSDWLLCIDNPEAITSLYEQVPSLTQVELHRFSLNENGWVCKFTLAIPALPMVQPKRWGKTVSTVHIEFGVAEMLSLTVPHMESWPRNRTVQLILLQREHGVHLTATGERLRIELEARRLHVCSITGLDTNGLWNTPAGTN